MVKEGERGDVQLHAHQREVLSMILKDSVLCLHGTGTGKTLTAAGAAATLLQKKKVRRVLVMTRASAVGQFAR